MTEEEAPPRSFYPVALHVSALPCLVVGGGRVAARKAKGLLEAGAAVTVIAPELHDEMEALVPVLDAVERRAYRTGDATAFRLVLTTTGDVAVDGAVHEDAEAAGVWVNAADDATHSTFILPAVYRDGSVTVSVSTGGLSPALASWLRDRLADACGDGIGTLANLLAEVRSRLVANGVSTASVDWSRVIDEPLLQLVRTGDIDKARAMLTATTTTTSQLGQRREVR